MKGEGSVCQGLNERKERWMSEEKKRELKKGDDGGGKRGAFFL